jgi:hypothetical protein
MLGRFPLPPAPHVMFAGSEKLPCAIVVAKSSGGSPTLRIR